VHELHFPLAAQRAQGRSDDLNGHTQALGYLACAPKLPVYLAPHVINGPRNVLVIHFLPLANGNPFRCRG
jgi:hypothetical protein